MTAPQPTPSVALIDFISAFFVPMFLAATNGDIALAREAALQTINAYRIQHEADLLAVAQVVAFGFATLSSLTLSMDDAISLNMILRLRGNANACHRSGEKCRQALQASHQATESAAAPDIAAPQPRPPVDAAQAPAAPMAEDRQRRAEWAAAYAQMAEEYAAELPNLPPEEQKLASVQIAALNSTASALLADPLPPGASGPSLQPDKPQPQPA